MKNRVAIFYFTGTGNTKLIAETVRETMESDGAVVRMIDMAAPDPASETGDAGEFTSGFVFPVYGLSLPRIVRTFMANMPEGRKREYFLIANAHTNTGRSRTVAKRILGRKGYRLIGSTSTFTPSSSIITEETEPEEQAVKMRERAVLLTRRFAADLVRGRAEMEGEHFSLRERGVSLLFSTAMPRFVLKKTSVSGNCRSCGLCAKICPVGNILMVEGKPQWNSACETCMRCINFCPSRAIEMMSSRGRAQYREPQFEKEIKGGRL